ncbi:MAG TPA: endonuclease/exonuclease/phosphatase family protein [Pyrinomonadaceae bacterium]
MRLRVAFIIAFLIALLALGMPPRPAARLSSPPGAFDHKLRVMTYNIHVGVGMDKKLDLQRIADVINDQHPDLVGLQEVDRGVQRTQRIDEVAEIAKLTRMEYAFAFNLAYQGGQYGVAILSKLPMMATDHRLFRNLREAERRGFIRAEVSFHGRTLNFVTTHLDYQYADGRLFEWEQLLEALKDVTGPLIVVGDFNDTPDGGAYKLMRERFDDAWMDNASTNPGFSYPADKPAKRIDYILLRHGDQTQTKRSWTMNTLASDHIPVIADVEVK